MARSITFPHVGNGIRRNAETGVEIHTEGGGRFTVMTFHADKGGLYTEYDSLREARAAAKIEAEMMRDVIAMAYDEAHELPPLRVITIDASKGKVSREAFDAALAAADETPAVPADGTIVEFRPDFSAALVGMRFEVHEGSFVAADGQTVVRLRIRRGKRWNYRTAYLTDIVTVAA